MDASLFISRRLRFKGGIAMLSIAISYLVMIIAVSVSSGFRNEIREGLASISGDVQLTPPNLNVLDSSRPIESDPSYLPHIRQVEGVESISPVVYRAGIVRQSGEIHGVLFKGVERPADTVALGVSVPKRLAELAGLKVGDKMTTYFIGEKVRLRQFNVTSIYDALVEADDKLVVYASLSDLQRLDGWAENQVSAIEIIMDSSHNDELSIMDATQEIGAYVNAYSSESEAPVVAVSSVSKYPQLFDWLGLIDFNVFFILLLMTIVAGFNMISGLLIMLFENISTIGLLKALGMTDRAISKIFLSSAAVLVLKGMAIGNALAFLFAIVQNTTHLLKLNPENYFVSFVPVNVDFAAVLTADVLSFVVIMLLLLVPALFISKVDPAQTVRVK
jgi:lipoprotein-releasing system permease protein